MMDERTFEEKLDEMLAEAARMTEEEPVDMDNQTTDDDGKEIVFSKEHERRMKKIFAMAEDYERSKKKLEREIEKIDERATKRHLKMAKLEEKAKRKEAKKALADKIKAERESNGRALGLNLSKRNVALTCVAVLIIGIIMVPTAGAWRNSLGKILFRPAKEYSEFNNVKTNENTAEVDGVKFYYVPKGFTFEGTKEVASTKIITFANPKEEQFFDLKILGQGFDVKVNTESGEIKDVSTKERDMILVKNEREMFITWQDAKNVYVLDGNCDEKTLKKIAENIKFVRE